MLKLFTIAILLTGCGISYTESEIQRYTAYCNSHGLDVKLFREGFTNSVTGMQCIDLETQEDLLSIQRK